MLQFSSLAKGLNCLVLALLVLNVSATDYYEQLGITRDANNKEIRKAFKKLALTMHPDKNIEDPSAHDRFVNLNKAYEVLKDPETRKKYDAYGEKGLKDDFGSGWTGSFHSWNYYQDNFGIYDDDPEIVTLSLSDFERFVENSQLFWFVNFYSPQCSHCHILAPNWRILSRSLEGVVQFGAVNCGDEWRLCRQLNIRSYPSLVLYPVDARYQGTREVDDMEDFVLKHAGKTLRYLFEENFQLVIKSPLLQEKLWLIYFCINRKECWDQKEIDKVGIQLQSVYNVGFFEECSSEGWCKKLGQEENGWVVFTGLDDSGKSMKREALDYSDEERKDMVNSLLSRLPSIEEYDSDAFQTIRDGLSSGPWLIYFKGPNEGHSNLESALKLLHSAPFGGLKVGALDCQAHQAVCSELYISKLPAFVIFRPGSSYEVFHGEPSHYTLWAFAEETLKSRVHTLEPHHFPGTIVHSGEPWFVDFFAPWCPPCMALLPEWRKASWEAGEIVKFGSVDCTIHKELCSSYGVKSYPTAILFNQTVPHQYYGGHNHRELFEFVQDVLNPTIVTLNPNLFSKLVEEKPVGELWAIDFYVPWCGPCQKLGPHWRKIAKEFADEPTVHIGQLDCQEHGTLCQKLGIGSYPTLRIYPIDFRGTQRHSKFQGWSRDSDSLRAWIRRHLPSVAKTLSSEDFFQDVLLSGEPWLVDFYAPWCGHCQLFEPTFEQIAKKLEGKVKAGKLNCEENKGACRQAGINAYPSLRFYEGQKDGKTQIPWGEEIESQGQREILHFISRRIQLNKVKDEL